MRQEQEVKGIQIGRKEINLSLFTDVIIVYVQNPKALTKPNRSTTTKLELSHNDCKVIGRIQGSDAKVICFTNTRYAIGILLKKLIFIHF